MSASTVVLIGGAVAFGATGHGQRETMRATQSIAAIGSEPVPKGFPSGLTTGVRPGTRLHIVRGDIQLTTRGAVLKNAMVFGCVQVNAPDVKILNTKIACSESRPALATGGAVVNAVFTNVEIAGGTNTPVGLEGKNFVATRLNIYGSGDGVHLGSSTTLRDSYIHDLGLQPNIHHDALQSSRFADGSTIRVLHNTLQVATQDTNGNAAYHVGSGSLRNLQVFGNYMDGGNFTVQVGNTPNQRALIFKYNSFGRDYRFGILAAGTGHALQFSQNSWEDNGKPATEANSRGHGRGATK